MLDAGSGTDTATDTDGEPSLERGTKVEANYKGKGKWYKGRISRVVDQFTFDVTYDDGDSERRVSKRNIKLINGEIVKKSFNNVKKLSDEISWLEEIPTKLKNKFPTIIDYKITPRKATLKMEYYQGNNLSDIIIDQELSINYIETMITNVSKFMFENIYPLNKRQAPDCFFRKCYLEKVSRRVEAARGKNEIFDKILLSKKIKVNNISCMNAIDIINKMSSNSKYLSTLESPFLSTTHGDFKPDNIMCKSESNDFILIDPRGRSSYGTIESDYLEDCAKMLTSLESFYDLIIRGYYNLKTQELNNCLTFRIDFDDRYRNCS